MLISLIFQRGLHVAHPQRGLHVAHPQRGLHVAHPFKVRFLGSSWIRSGRRTIERVQLQELGIEHQLVVRIGYENMEQNSNPG
jgi:hypothetical protein